MKRILLTLAALAAAATLAAQTDSVMVFGSVTNYHMGSPMPGCTIHLVQGEDTVFTTISDADGYFFLRGVPAGSYTLSVEREFSMYLANLVLAENAELTIAVDTIQHVNLQPVQVTSYRHLLGEQLISSSDDPRLHNMNGKMDGGEASIQDPGRLSRMDRKLLRKKRYHRKGFPLIQDYFPDVARAASKKKK